LTRPGASIARREFSRLALLARALRCDVVHLNFGSTIFPSIAAPTPAGPTTPSRWTYRLVRELLSGKDLWLLERLGKVIVVTFQGDDVRPSTRHAGAVAIDSGQDHRKRELVELFRRHGVHMLALNPDLMAELPEGAQFVPYANVDPRTMSVDLPDDRDQLVVGHAPTHRSVKGTEVVLAAVAALQNAGFAIELELIEGVSNSSVQQRLARCHVVIDQLRLGWYGGFAVEAMAHGKPVIAFIDELQLSCTEKDFREALPIIRTTADSLIETLRNVIQMPRADLRQVGLRSREFVETFHDPQVIAQQMSVLYRSLGGR
jgi:hypothetical protein